MPLICSGVDCIRPANIALTSLRRSRLRLPGDTDRLQNRAVGGAVPGGEPEPLLSTRIEWDFEMVGAERRQFGRRYKLPSRRLAVAPHNLDEIEREGPLHVRHKLGLA